MQDEDDNWDTQDEDDSNWDTFKRQLVWTLVVMNGIAGVVVIVADILGLLPSLLNLLSSIF